MSGLCFGLVGKNSSQDLFLTAYKENGSLYLTLHGKYEGKYIQVDFNELSESECEDLILLISKKEK